MRNLSSSEKWKSFYGYKVSDHGNVYSTFSKKLLKPFTNNGYLYVTIANKGSYKKYSVHRLVAMLFIPNPNNLPYVNHKDENKQNNCVENLEWCTASYNTNYGSNINRIRHTRLLKGSATPVYAISTKSKEVFYFESIKKASNILGIDERNLHNCLLYKAPKSVNGFILVKSTEFKRGKDFIESLVTDARSSKKYPRDFIINERWVCNMSEARKITGATRVSIHDAINAGKNKVKGYTVRLPSLVEIENHYKMVYKNIREQCDKYYSSF